MAKLLRDLKKDKALEGNKRSQYSVNDFLAERSTEKNPQIW